MAHKPKLDIHAEMHERNIQFLIEINNVEMLQKALELERNEAEKLATVNQSQPVNQSQSSKGESNV